MKNFWQQLIALAYSLWAAYVQKTQTPIPPPVTPTSPFDLHGALTSLIAARTKNTFTTYHTQADGSKVINAYIPALTTDEASQVAILLIASCTAKGIADLAFVAAAMYQESRWAPAYNRNLGENNGIITFAGTDWGQGQFSGKEVLNWPEFKGLTETQMQAKLLDPTYSIPKFIERYALQLQLAKAAVTPEVIAQMDKLPSWCMTPTNSLAEMQEWYACVAYNAGDHGVREILASGGYKVNAAGQQVAEHHGQEIQTWMSQFRPFLEPPHALAA